MAERLRRFLVVFPPEASAGRVVIMPPAEVRHLRVLRLSSGTEVELFDGAGSTARAKLRRHDNGWEAVLTEEPQDVSNCSVQPAGEKNSGVAPAPTGLRPVPALVPVRRVFIGVAWPKGRRAAWLVEKCVELGVAGFWPVSCARSVARKAGGSASTARLQRVAAAAAKQCGRAEVPKTAEERPLRELLAASPPHDLGVLLTPDAAADFAALLREADAVASAAQSPVSVFCLVGPEGGFTVEERRAAAAVGFREACLNPCVLRVETAAVAACAVAAAVVSE